MQDFRMLAGFKHELESGPAEEGEPQQVIIVPINAATVEKIVRRMGVDEKTFRAMNVSKPNGRVNCAIKPGHAQMLVGAAQAPDLIVTHAIVFRQDDFDRVAP